MGEMEVTTCLTLKDLISTKKPKSDPVTDGRSAYKENMFDRFKISPRLPLRSEPIDLSKHKSFTPERIPVTPVKVAERPQADPWTPTANLKMLISAASPEIRDREKKKELFRPIENNGIEKTDTDLQLMDCVDDIDDLEKRPSRKQKSLGLLCQKFLARYPSYPISTEKMTISLDEAASSLGVERRRIYDIVNVLESLHLVGRVAKNQYCWHGQHNLNETLSDLQRVGEKQNYRAQIACFHFKDMGMEYKCDEQKKGCNMDQQNTPFIELSEADCPSVSSSSRKDKSLRIMSQKFVMLFLVSTTKIISLEIAAKILIEESQDAADHSKFKTKVRRLYDIANVLTSLGLIKKVHVTDERGRKPAFKWIGPADFSAGVEDQKMEVTTTTPSPDSKKEACSLSPASDRVKQRLFRHSSFNVVQSFTDVKRKVCSQPCSPQKPQGVESSDSYASKMAHLATIYKQKTEEDSKHISSTSRNGSTGNAALPFSVVVPVPVKSDYCVQPVVHEVPHKTIHEPLSIVPPSQSHEECTNHGFVPNQPYMYLPSNSVIMLCGNLSEGKASEQLAKSLHLVPGSDFPTSEESNTSKQERPTKRQHTGKDDAPLSLVLPKKSRLHDTQSLWKTVCKPTTPEQLHHVSSGKEYNTEPGTKPNNLGEHTEQVGSTLLPSDHVHVQPAVPPQFLYVPTTAGLNGFNFLVHANHSVGLSPSQLASLNVPYVMVPSSALTAFPFICSPAVPSGANCSSSNGGMNFSQAGTSSPTHLTIGASQMAAPRLFEAAVDQAKNSSPLSTSTGSGMCGGSKADSHDCLSQSVHNAKLHKSPTPSTPKSIRPIHKDAFFKTPGSLDVSSSRKRQRTQTRTSSSAQRKLDIDSSVVN
ncbi:E2F transcription factor 7 L homeolog isoform X1 [Xenopus laevis]|uniref:Transcription factor E2F7 n=1 Tax=Xenopus laevis TaxID=8355 RepID=A0A8J0US24_XENLA|nr:E2F transcription factor 7 L homeolog isoform X1 [Xenopus laevis]